MIPFDFRKINPTEQGSPQAKSELRQRARRQDERWIVCRACSANIARQEWILDEGSHAPLFFSNPHGRAFQLLLVTQTEGMSHDLVFTSEHTWFSGYEWSIGICHNCRSHLGWQFRATRLGLSRTEFAALSRAQVRLPDESM